MKFEDGIKVTSYSVIKSKSLVVQSILKILICTSEFKEMWRKNANVPWAFHLGC